ncbi:hypothetical protein [uncultured Paraglaciecola sp.]|uniref:hypothetical protein n=1 Tax=uncultured Paraglaciecola sp. TaxID=1765024 RepID=UPI00262E5EA1|nr:hypothetical protein [uncultured Paraglaciecola sp.]
MGNKTQSGGVCEHSKEYRYKEFIIFSVSGSIQKNAEFWSWATAQGLSIKLLFGCYKGKPERSYIVPFAQFYLYSRWTALQESVLLLSGNERTHAGGRTASLHWINGPQYGRRPTILGKLINTTAAFAKTRENWSYCPTTHEYWVTENAQEWLK